MLDRTIKPRPTGEIDFTIPKIQKSDLSNGLEIYYINKKTLPIVQINLVIPAGSIYNSPNRHGVSTLTSMLIDEGAGNLNGLEISDKIETLGSILNVGSNKEFTTLSLLTLKENLSRSLEIFTMILESPTFAVEDFKRESQRLQTQLLQLNDDPSYLASVRFHKIIYNSTPYQYPSDGIENSLKSINNSEVKNFYNNRYIPSSSYLTVVGDVEIDDASNYFGGWKNNIQYKKISPDITPTRKQIVLIDKPDAIQSEIRMGHFSKGRKSEDFFARSVLNSILGGQFSSRINLNLREDKGYTYGAHSNYSYNQIGSTFSISTSVKTENTINAIKELFNELENIKLNISPNEVEFAKSYLVRRYPSLFETHSQLATNLSLLPIFNLDLGYFSDYIEKINDININEVNKSANENILLDNLVIVVVGNAKMLENELKSLAELRNIEFKKND